MKDINFSVVKERIESTQMPKGFTAQACKLVLNDSEDIVKNVTEAGFFERTYRVDSIGKLYVNLYVGGNQTNVYVEFNESRELDYTLPKAVDEIVNTLREKGVRNEKLENAKKDLLADSVFEQLREDGGADVDLWINGWDGVSFTNSKYGLTYELLAE